MMYRVQLKPNEIEQIMNLLEKLCSKYKTVEDHEFLDNVNVYAHELPQRLRMSLNHFRLSESHGGTCLISGYPVNVNALAATPNHWKNKPAISPTIKEDIYFALCSSLLGDFIGWATQQDGYILHDVLPIKGHENEQLGSGSEVLLTWHTEDAFHPYRTDYLGLMCLKNPDHVETTFGQIDEIALDPSVKNILFQNRFIIRPDESHLEKNRSTSGKDLGAPPDFLRRSYNKINQMNENPEKIAVLFGALDHPYVRLDPYFMDTIDDDPEAMEALNILINHVDKNLQGIMLQPGEILFLDNYKVVHGRKSFKARYDGTDRWLKRLNIARDLRKSRDVRMKAKSRIIF